MRALPVPPFYAAEHASEFAYRPDPTLLFDEALRFRREHGIKPAGSDRKHVRLLLVDLQRDFCFPEGSLYVGGRSGCGALEDSDRLVRFLYRNLDRISDTTCTLDTHYPFQIFFSSFWRGRDGAPLVAHRVVRAEEVRVGDAVPNPEVAAWLSGGDVAWLRRQAEFYCETLEKGGKYSLYLWPPHCLLGGDGHALAGVVQEARLFHAYARSARASTEIKGGHPLTENYSVLSPEVLVRFDGIPLAARNEALVDELLGADALIVAGQAASHCVKHTLEDLLEAIGARDPKLAQRIYILRDCMSAVAVPDPARPGEFLFDFTPQADAALDRCREAGMQVVESTAPVDSWPGFPRPVSGMDRIYLDHNATTPLDPRVFAAMRPWLEEGFGNASSLHFFGQRARAAVEEARGRVAALVGATPAEIVFTSGGTEADNLALRGAMGAAAGRRKVVVTAIEHHAVLNTAKALGAEGFTVEVARITPEGRVDLDDLRARLDEATAVLSVMLANNETGMLQPVAEAAALARARGALVHCDAVQAAGKVAVDVSELDCDLLSLSAHKIYGPQGVGALYVRRGTSMKALLRGGSQERNRRAGTENVAGAVGFGRAAEIARGDLGDEAGRLLALRDRLEGRLLSLPGARRNGDGPRLPNTTNVSFEGADAEALLVALDLGGIAVSTGAACAAGAAEPSHVLVAMGLSPERVQGSLRFSLGRATTEVALDHAAAAVVEAVDSQLRS